MYHLDLMPNFVPDPHFTGMLLDIAAVAAPLLQKHGLEKKDQKDKDKEKEEDGTETGGIVGV